MSTKAQKSKKKIIAMKSVNKTSNLEKDVNQLMVERQENFKAEKMIFNERFREESKEFKNLTQKKDFCTDAFPVVNVILNTASDRIIALLKYNDENYLVIQYSSVTNKPLDKIEIRGTYIKAQFIGRY